MPLTVFENIRIAGVAASVPSVRVVNSKEHAYVSEEDRLKIIALTGVEEYRKADEKTCASDLCEAAARELLTGLNIDPGQIDAVVFVSMTPDYRIPSTACLLQDRLGCSKSSIAYDINMGCSGYIVGLYNVCSLIQGAGLSKVLLLTGDTQTKLCYPYDKNVAFILADGGTATLIESKAGAEPITIELYTDGGRFKSLYIPAGGFREPSSTDSREVRMRQDGALRADDHLHMSGMDIFKFSSTDVVETLESFLREQNADPSDFVSLYLHQANKFMLDKIAVKLKFPKEKVPFSIRKYGNTGSASIPLTIAHHLSTSDASGNGRNLFCGFGVGLSWGIVDLKFDDIFVPPVKEYVSASAKQKSRLDSQYVFVFPGQGSQAIGMGKALYEKDKNARDLFAYASEILNIDLVRLCFKGPESELAKTQYVQPAVTVVNIAALKSLSDAGIEPVALGGHSLGEYSALFAAGSISLENTLRLVRERGRLMQDAADADPGGMLAIMGLSRELLIEICCEASANGDAAIANHNSVSQFIITGSATALAKVANLAEKAGAGGVVPLNVSGPWHSRFMRPAGEAMREVIENVSVADPKIPVVSNVSGEFYGDAAEIKARLVEQITAPVNWVTCISSLRNRFPAATILEVGPGAMLTGLSRDIDSAIKALSFDQFGDHS